MTRTVLDKTLIVMGVVCSCLVAQSAQRCKVLVHAHDTLTATPSDVLRNAESFDRLPVDGVFLNFKERTATGKQYSNLTILRDEPWDYSAFEGQIPVVREIVQHPSLRHSFAFAGLVSWALKPEHRLEWTDDAAWANCAHNFGVLARIAREGGLEGICVDCEDYGGVRQFVHRDSDGDFAATFKLARKRGREVFGAIFKEMPNAKIMSFWMFSMNWIERYRGISDVAAALHSHRDLWPAFLNGMLDVMPEDARFIDGNESSYFYDSARNAYFRAASEIRNDVQAFVAPENRSDYRSKLLVAQAMYFDAYGYVYNPPAGASRLDRFNADFEQCVASSDGYVWLYADKHPMFKWSGTKGWTDKRSIGPNWDEVLPGCVEIVGSHRDSSDFGEKTFRLWQKAGRLPPNRVSAGNCVLEDVKAGSGFLTNRLAKGFTFWKDHSKPGAYGTDCDVGRSDRFSLRLDRMEGGCGIYRLGGLRPGEHYVVRVFAHGANARFTVGFMTGETQRNDIAEFGGRFGPADEKGWHEGFASIVVPGGTDGMSVYFMGDSNGTVRFDDLGIYVDSPKGEQAKN